MKYIETTILRGRDVLREVYLAGSMPQNSGHLVGQKTDVSPDCSCNKNLNDDRSNDTSNGPSNSSITRNGFHGYSGIRRRDGAMRNSICTTKTIELSRTYSIHEQEE